MRNYDDEEYARHDDEQANEDEFFLISTPSPFNLAHLAASKSATGRPQEFELIEHDDLNAEYLEDGDENTNDYASRHQLRYQTMYEMNRLSNIIEEEEQTELQQQMREQQKTQQMPEENEKVELEEATFLFAVAPNCDATAVALTGHKCVCLLKIYAAVQGYQKLKPVSLHTI